MKIEIITIRRVQTGHAQPGTIRSLASPKTDKNVTEAGADLYPPRL